MKKTIEKKDLREFGITLGAILLVINLLRMLLKAKSANIWLISFGIIFFFLGLFFPNTLRRIYLVWLRMAHFIGRCNSSILLFLLYYLILTPTGIIIKIFGHDPLGLKNNQSEKTHWISIKNKFAADRMKNQF